MKNNLLISMSIVGLSNSLLAEDDKTRSEDYFANESAWKLTSYDPNYGRWIVPLGSNKMDEQQHLEFYLSLKYPVFLKQSNDPNKNYRVNVVYNGLYDFYLGGSGQYDSSPVISRAQNPGITFEYNARNLGSKNLFNRFEFGLFHRSNGQSVESSGDADMNGIADSIQNNLGGSGQITDYTLSSVSRSSNYLSLRYTIGSEFSEVRPLKKDAWWRASVEYRHYISLSDDIWWDESDNSSLRDYDGLRISYERAFRIKSDEPNLILGASVRAGTNSFEALGNITYSIDLDFRLPSTNAWLSLSYFNGYSENLSTYHLDKEFIGIGFKLF